jgi:uncharacterized protein (TIGR02246 family)
MKKYLLLALLPLVIMACNQQPTESTEAVEQTQEIDMAAVTAEIQALEDAYAAAQNAGDIEGVLVYYADDAVNMPNEMPIVVGKEAIRQRLTEQYAQNQDEGGTISFKVESIMANGDLLVEAGSSTYTSADGEVSTGKYVSIFEKRDGKYVCVRDIWNEDQDDDEDEDGENDESTEEM